MAEEREKPFVRSSVARGAVISALCVAVALLAGWRWFLAGADAYKVDGIPFRQWVAEKPDFQIQEPMAKLGTNALPHLRQILRKNPESRRIFKLRQRIWKALPQAIQARYPHLNPVPDWQVRRTALFAIRFLGEEGRPALPQVVKAATGETNRMVRAAALVAALAIAPQAPQTFDLWRAEWMHATTYPDYISHRDLALYVHMTHVPMPASASYLLKEATDPISDGRLPALEAFEFFDEDARQAVPEMIRVLQQKPNLNVLQVLETLGPVALDAVPALVQCATNSEPMPETVFHAASGGAVAGDARPDLIVGALAALKSIGPGAEAALPAIAPLLTNPNANIRIMAAAALLRIGGAKEAEATGVLVDGLENRLRGSQSFLLPIKFEELPADGTGWAARGAAAAAILLGEAGPAARASIPHLESRLHSSNFELQIFAAQAIWRISADATKALPVMIAVLDSIPAPNPQGVSGASQDYRLVKTIEIIGQMGPAARNALPSLERVRAFSPAAARAVKRAIARIEAGGPPPLTPNTR